VSGGGVAFLARVAFAGFVGSAFSAVFRADAIFWVGAFFAGLVFRAGTACRTEAVRLAVAALGAGFSPVAGCGLSAGGGVFLAAGLAFLAAEVAFLAAFLAGGPVASSSGAARAASAAGSVRPAGTLVTGSASGGAG